jgi:replication factor A1
VRSKVSVGEYLAFLSTKFEVDPDGFFQALISAEKSKQATVGELRITCRSRNTEKAVMLISKGSRVVAQFPVPQGFLLEQRNPIRAFRKTSLTNRTTVGKNDNPHSLHIKDLRTGMKQINLQAKVLEIPKPKMVFTRFGNYASVVNVIIGDETGQIKLCLWNEQINSISIGDVLQIENARMSTFRGEKQLRIGKKGTLSSVASLSAPLEQMHNS